MHPSHPVLTALIVEDSPSDTLNLRTLLESYPAVRVIGEAPSLRQARELVLSRKPNLVFLDVELGPQLGTDLLPDLPTGTRLIFTTVHRRYAVDAFDIGAVDYLVKPITEDRLLRALRRIEAFAEDTPSQHFTNIPVYRGGAPRQLIPIDSMLAVLADGNYSRVLTRSLDIPDHRRFSAWIGMLADRPFTRLDRSTLINLQEITSWQPHGRGALVQFRGARESLSIGRSALSRLVSLPGISKHPAT